MIDFNLPLGIALLAVFAGTEAVALRFLRKGRRPVPAAVRPDAFAPPPAQDADEREILRAWEIDQAHQTALQGAYDAHLAEVAEAERLIARAGEHVRRAGLAFAVPYLWEELRGGACPVDGAETATSGVTVAWQWRDAAYCIGREALPGGDPARESACFTVTRDGETVLAMTCQRDSAIGPRRFRFVSVEALEVGAWVTELVDFAGRLRTALETGQARKAAQRTLGAAARIRLGAAAAVAVPGVH